MTTENLQPPTYVIVSIAFIIGTLSTVYLGCQWRSRIFGRDDAMAVLLLVGRFLLNFRTEAKAIQLVNPFQHAILYIFLYYGCGL